MKRFVVVGLGNFGASVAEALRRVGHEVAALDLDPAKVERMASSIRRAVVGDGTDPEVLERTGARDADAGVVSTGDDVTASVLTALGLRDLGVRSIFVKVVSETHARILEKLGVGDTIFPERESAQLLAKRMVSSSVLNYVYLGPSFSVQEVAVPESWVGRSLRDIELPRKYNVSVIAIRDYLSGEVTPVPDPDTPLKGSEALLVAGRDEALERVARVG